MVIVRKKQQQEIEYARAPFIELIGYNRIQMAQDERMTESKAKVPPLRLGPAASPLQRKKIVPAVPRPESPSAYSSSDEYSSAAWQSARHGAKAAAPWVPLFFLTFILTSG